MRLLYFTEGDTPHDRRFLNALAGTTHRVFALRMKPCNPQTPLGVTELTWAKGEPDWSNWQGWQGGVVQFRQVLDAVQPDLVHAGPVQGPALVTALAEFHPLVTMSWGSDLLRTAKRSPGMRLATQYVLDRTDIFLGDCKPVADAAAGYGFPWEEMVLFPWGVDLGRFSPENGLDAGQALRRELGWEDQFVVLCSRSWAPIYGVDQLAEAFVAAAKVNPRLRLLLVGDGPEADKIHQLLAPASEKVHFAGWIDQAEQPTYYHAADLYVSPSHSDGSSISMLEAMACARPVLVSDIPGNREWVVDGEAGWRFKDGEVDDLEEKLLFLAADPALTSHGREGRRIAELRADWKRNFQKCLQAYQLALA